MFERRPKVVTLDTIGELCKSSKIKKSENIVVKKSVEEPEMVEKVEIVVKKKEGKPTMSYKLDKHEETILWL